MRFLLTLIVLLIAGAAQAEPLTIDLSEDRVDITTGFDGTSIIVYGVTADQGDIAVTLKGPERTMVVRRKGEVMGAWINAQSVEFHRVPGFYDYAVSAPVESSVALAEHIGLEALDFYHEESLSESDERRFRDALVRNKQTQGLFPLQGRAVQTLGDNFFKVTFPLPSNVPSGLYRIDAYLLDGQTIEAKAEKTLQVGQVGFSARVYLFAHDHAFLYGVMAILLAISAGWGAFTFLRRD